MAARALGANPDCLIIDGRAEATTLPDHNIDLITVAQAINWFEPEPTKAEFWRILKPGGWLAIIRNYETDPEVGEALERIFPPETDTLQFKSGSNTPRNFYYGGDDYLRQSFAFTNQATWEQFLGAHSSASYAPDEESPLYASFERAAKEVFDRFSTGGVMVTHAATELYLGQIRET